LALLLAKEHVHLLHHVYQAVVAAAASVDLAPTFAEPLASVLAMLKLNVASTHLLEKALVL
jgi:hypothetical protein